MTPNTSMNAEAEEETIAGWNDNPNTSRWKSGKIIQVIKTTKWTASRSSSNNKEIQASIRAAVG